MNNNISPINTLNNPTHTTNEDGEANKLPQKKRSLKNAIEPDNRKHKKTEQELKKDIQSLISVLSTNPNDQVKSLVQTQLNDLQIKEYRIIYPKLRKAFNFNKEKLKKLEAHLETSHSHVADLEKRFHATNGDLKETREINTQLINERDLINQIRFSLEEQLKEEKAAYSRETKKAIAAETKLVQLGDTIDNLRSQLLSLEQENTDLAEDVKTVEAKWRKINRNETEEYRQKLDEKEVRLKEQEQKLKEQEQKMKSDEEKISKIVKENTALKNEKGELENALRSLTTDISTRIENAKKLVKHPVTNNSNGNHF